jgi:ABC-type Na+ efflux pump permease subunit
MKPLWTWMYTFGLVIGFVGIPALLGFLAGSRIDAYSGVAHRVPFRLLFVALGVGVGGMVAWRVLTRRRTIE